MRLLVVEDHQKIAESIQKGLKVEGFAVDILLEGLEAQRRIEQQPELYDLVILDRMLPGKDGLSICKDIRAQGIHVPILLLTAKDSIDDRVNGLNAGADDYLVKPFAFDELVARVRTLLRRPKLTLPTVLQVGDVTLDATTKRVTRGNKDIKLTAKEFALLEYLMHHPGQVLTREQMIHKVWDTAYDSFSNVIDVHMKNLRAKLHSDHDESIVQTIRGVGYLIRG